MADAPLLRFVKCSNPACDIAGAMRNADATVPLGWWTLPGTWLFACSEACVNVLDAAPHPERRHGFHQFSPAEFGGETAARYRVRPENAAEPLPSAPQPAASERCSTCAILMRLEALRHAIHRIIVRTDAAFEHGSYIVEPGGAALLASLDSIFIETSGAAIFCRGDHEHADPSEPAIVAAVSRPR